MEEEGNIKTLVAAVPQQSTQNVFQLVEKLKDSPGSTVTVKNEKVAPIRAESPSRRHCFHDVDSFARWVSNYKSTDTTVFVDMAKRRIVASLNEKATHGFETVLCEPLLHPRYVPWRSFVAEKTVNLERFVDWVLTHRRDVTDGKALALLLSQLRVSTHIERHIGSGKKSLNGLLVKMEIQGTKKDEIVEVPDSLMLNLPLYVGEKPDSVEIDLVINAKNDEITVTMGGSDMETQEIAAFEEMAERLTKSLPVMVTRGAFNTADWRYQ